VADRGLLVETLSRYSIEVVIHFAGSAYVGESMESPETYFENNAVNSLRLLSAMRETGCRDMIFSSSCATYGMPQRPIITERHPQQPINPYGESKLFVERALHWYELAYGMRWVALRYFNAAGADPDGEIGEVHCPETHLVPLVIQAALSQGPAVEVWGSDYPTSDGTAVRDYVHVTDLAAAHIGAIEYLQRGGESAAMNLGNGRGYSVREVIGAVERLAGRPLPWKDGPRRPGDPPVLVARSTLARRRLGWKAQFGDIDAIVRTAWNWHASHPPDTPAAAGE
jgi:UDP-arabinose 4-epimerase